MPGDFAGENAALPLVDILPDAAPAPACVTGFGLSPATGLVLASSGKTQHVEAFLDLIDAKSLADAWTTSDDVKHSKPEPDIVATALAKVDGASAVMVGDSIFDAQAAGKLKIPTLGVRTGGFSVGSCKKPAFCRSSTPWWPSARP